MDIEGLHGVGLGFGPGAQAASIAYQYASAEEKKKVTAALDKLSVEDRNNVNKAQALISNIVSSDANTILLLNKSISTIATLKQKGLPVDPKAEETLQRITRNLAERQNNINKYVKGDGFLMKAVAAPAAMSRYVESLYKSATSGAKEVWNYFFSGTDGLGIVPVAAAVLVIVFSAGAAAIITHYFSKDWGKAQSDAKDINSLQSVLSKAVNSGLITKQQADQVNEDVNKKLQDEHDAGAKGQWWKSWGTLAKIGIPVLVGGAAVIYGIPKLNALRTKK